MIGLTKKQSVVYVAINHLRDTKAIPPNRRAVAVYLNERTFNIGVVIDAMKRRGFVVENKVGDLSTLVPPHEAVLADVLSRTSVTLADVTGACKAARIVAIRRVIAKRLHNECGYGFRTIARVLNKSPRVVVEYFQTEKCALRSERRKAKYRARRATELEMRAAA